MKYIKYLLIITFVFLLYLMMYGNMFYEEDKVFYDEVTTGYANVLISPYDQEVSFEIGEDGSVFFDEKSNNESLFEISSFLKDVDKNGIDFIYDDFKNGMVYVTERSNVCDIVILASNSCSYPLTNKLEQAKTVANYYLFPSDITRTYDYVQNIPNKSVHNLEILVLQNEVENFKNLYGNKLYIVENESWEAVYLYDAIDELIVNAITFIIILTITINVITYSENVRKRKAHLLMKINGVSHHEIILKQSLRHLLETVVISLFAVVLAYIIFSYVANEYFAQYFLKSVLRFTGVVVLVSAFANYLCLYSMMKTNTYDLLDNALQVKKGFHTLTINYGIVLFLVFGVTLLGSSGIVFQIEDYIGSSMYNIKTKEHSMLTVSEDEKQEYLFSKDSFQELLLIGIYGNLDFLGDEVDNTIFRIYDINTFNYLNNTSYQEGIHFINTDVNSEKTASAVKYIEEAVITNEAIYFENYYKPIATFRSYDDKNIIILDFENMKKEVVEELTLFLADKTTILKKVFHEQDYTNVSFEESNYDRMYRVKFITVLSRAALLIALLVVSEIILLKSYLIFHNKREFHNFINKKGLLFQEYYKLLLLVIGCVILIKTIGNVNILDLLINLFCIMAVKVVLHIYYSNKFYRRPKDLEEYYD